jgi:hypothetical protein
MLHYPRPPFPDQRQPMPGKTAAMNPTPDHGETSYKGSGRLNGKKVVITGGDSGIGRAIAIAYAREGADVLISYLDEHDDARETERLVTEAGRRAVLVPGDIQDPAQCRAIIAKAISELGGIDILVNNAAHQASFKSIDEISDEEWELTFKPRDVLSYQGGGTSHEAGQLHHQHGVDQFGCTQPDIAGLRNDQGGDP